jgi:hypothetical protein
MSAKDKNQAYREKVQQYADEGGSIWEDVKHGLVYGSEGFLNDLKERFLLKEKDAELPQHNRMFRDIDPQRVLQRASEALHIDLDGECKSRRISRNESENRDLLIYLLWESGRFVNRQIGSYLGISYSNVSRRITEIRGRLDQDKGLRTKYQILKAQIKV